MRMFRIIHVVLILSVYELIYGHTALSENVSLETKDSFPRSTSIRIPSTLRDILNQESLVRFSMVQQMQRLAMDVTEIKNDRHTLKRNIQDMMNELQTLTVNNQRLKQENDLLKENLTDLYITVSDNKHGTGKDSQSYNVSEILVMQRQISALQNDSNGLAMENANLKEKLGVFEKMDMMRLRNECLAVSQKYVDLLQENHDFKLQLKEFNATFSQSREVRDFDSRVQAIENRVQKLMFSTDASLRDIRDDLTVSNIQLQNISAEIWEDSRMVAIPSGSTVAFYAYMSSSDSNPGVRHTLIYDQEVTNVGNGYNRHSGTFTAPMNGVYVFTWTTFVQNAGQYMSTEITLNSKPVGATFPHGGGDYAGVTGSVVLSMQKSDIVFTRTHTTYVPRGSIRSDHIMRSTFSGWCVSCH